MTNWCKSCKYYGESALSYPCAVCERAYDEPPTKHENIDCVEVVRCKDCKTASINQFAKECGLVYCKHYLCGMRADDFCSYGERGDGV